ncbi:hypothetical protein [Halalkalibacter nanhaiisediminis]|uniref:Uncharacterized protein n=1 Tax=Halalkalibacter nanhaiisediminis TaxID=688079 RepID=A0A562QQL3_9BACI|nr:hypothetical protein [Halalkalibacter nanhaiisediminis]TWI59024.1 hypothetical protein IQ10_00735 [Halalkalibacter nanhaiisediminis]
MGKRQPHIQMLFENLKKYYLVVDYRILIEGEIITARRGSSSIDLGLYLCEKLAGNEAKENRLSNELRANLENKKGEDFRLY